MDKHPDDLLTGDGDPFKGDPNFMASLARGLEVIQAFTPQRPLLSISQISQKTGIPRAAVRRCLYTLSKLGFVYAEDGKNFQLRPRILALGHAWLASTPLARSAQPVLRHLERNAQRVLLHRHPRRGRYSVYRPRLQLADYDHRPGYRQPPSGLGDLDGPGAAQPSAGGEAQRHAGSGDHDPLHPADGGFGGEAARRTETGASAGVCPQRPGAGDGPALLAVPLFNAQGQVQAALNVGVHAGQMSAREMIDRVLPELQKPPAS